MRSLSCMNLREIEERVAAVEPRSGVEYLGDLLLAYGLPRTSVSRLMAGTYDKAETADERLWKDKVYFRCSHGPDEALYEYIDAAREDERVIKHRPRFLIVKNEQRLLARDQKTGATLDIAVGELASNATFFGAWAGFERCPCRARRGPNGGPTPATRTSKATRGQAL